MSKTRTEIPKDTVAKVQFDSDRTCCVCRERGKPIQIHHIDENPSNNDPANLAVLCFDCHHQTQLRGGFDRKLDGQQVVEFRDDWLRRVTKRRDLADELASGRTVGVDLGPDSPVASGEHLRGLHKIEGVELLTYIRTLPQILRRAYANAQPFWDSGVTTQMMQGSYDVIDVLEQVLIHLASSYPERHFGNQDSKEYINSMTASRFEWHRDHLETEGFGTSGTIVGPMAAANVMEDLKRMVTDMVGSLTLEEETFYVRVWQSKWEEAGE